MEDTPIAPLRWTLLSVLSVLMLIVSACSVLPGGEGARGEDEAPAVVDPVPTVLVIDSSGSMAIEDAPGRRMDAAVSAVRVLLDALPDEAELGVVTYGSTTTEADGPDSCTDIRTLSPLAPVNR